MRLSVALKKNTTQFEKQIIHDVNLPYTNSRTKITYLKYPYSVIKPSKNIKLGKKVLKGNFKNYLMYTLTLIERETCSPNCEHMNDCYGNNMRYAIRFKVNNNFMIRLEHDIKEIAMLPKNKHGFLLRLHVLGDFESVEYVKFWERMLKEISNLHIYGYTRSYDAHLIDVGEEILKMNNIFKERFRIRFSNDLTKEFSANSADITSKGITCLAQLKASVSCSTCTLCWASNKAIRFITH
jgi:hypothetical protein